MASYTVKLVPQVVNLGTEGGLDTDLVDGKSIQRTVNMLMTFDGNDRKMVVSVKDGDSFDDVAENLSNDPNLNLDAPVPTPTATVAPTPTATVAPTPTPTVEE